MDTGLREETKGEIAQIFQCKKPAPEWAKTLPEKTFQTPPRRRIRNRTPLMQALERVVAANGREIYTLDPSDVQICRSQHCPHCTNGEVVLVPRKKYRPLFKGYSDLRHGHPRAMAKPKVVESTRHFHHEIADGSTPDSQRILHHPAALDTTIDMLNAHPSARQCLIGRLLFGREGAPTGLFGRLQHLDPIQRKGEKAQILEQLAVGWQGIRRIVGNPFVMHLAFKGGTQKEDG